MALADVFDTMLRKGHGYQKGWATNWPPHAGRAVGVYGRVAGAGSIAYEGTIDQRGLTFKSELAGTSGAETFSRAAEGTVSVELGADVGAPGFKWLGAGKVGARAKLGTSEGLHLAVSGTKMYRIADIKKLRDDLVAAQKTGAMDIGDAVVIETHVADTAVLLLCEGRDGVLNLHADAHIGPKNLTTLAQLTGHWKIHNSKGGADIRNYDIGANPPQVATLAYRTIVIGKKGFLLWRRVTTLGMSPLDVVEEMEKDALASDYWDPEAEAAAATENGDR